MISQTVVTYHDGQRCYRRVWKSYLPRGTCLRISQRFGAPMGMMLLPFCVLIASLITLSTMLRLAYVHE